MRLRGSLIRILLVGIVLWFAISLRADRLYQPDFFTDEAESTTNAFGILEHGLPVDHYHGLPIFESPLTQTWPEHPEYEFRETVYSRQGVGLAHGWIPLYAIAASLRLGDVQPVVPSQPPRVLRSGAEIRRISFLARLPSLCFGLLFAVLLYIAGRTLFDHAVGSVAALLAALASSIVAITSQARYYSATLAFATLAALALWCFVRRPRLRSAIFLGLAFAILFFTHLSACLVSSALAVSCLPSVMRKRHGLRLAFVAGLVFALPAGCWVVRFGLLDGLGWTPMALSSLRLEDLLRTSSQAWGWTAFLGGHLLVVTGLCVARRQIGLRRYRRLFAHSFLARWVAVSVISVFAHPLVSLFWGRVFWTLIPPAILIVAAAIVAVAPGRNKWGGLSPLMLALALLLVSDGGNLFFRADVGRNAEVLQVVDSLRDRKFEAGTRFYANNHHTLGVYTGLPVQALAPVRKSFLESYPGPIVYIEYDPLAFFVNTTWIVLKSRSLGLSPSTAEAVNWTRLLENEIPRRRIQDLGAVTDTPEAIPAHLEPLVAAFFEMRRERVVELASSFGPVFHGQPARNLFLVYFYRFVDPESRLGVNLNLRGRLEGARATIISPRWVVYSCPALDRGKGARESQDMEETDDGGSP